MVAADAFNGEAAVILDNEYLQIPDTPNTMGKQDFLVWILFFLVVGLLR